MVKHPFLDEVVKTIGTKIKELRTEKELSLQQLANRAGVSATAVHKIERGDMTPTVLLMMKIADALGKKVAYFIDEEEDLDHYQFVSEVEFLPKGKRKKATNAPQNIEIEHLALRLKDGNLFAGIFRHKPGVKSGDRQKTHHGEELVYQIKGSMEYSIKDRTYRLRPGDSLHFLASLPHSWKVVGEESSVNLWIMTPPPLGMTEVWRNRGGKG